MNTCGTGPQCWISCILLFVGWLLVSSGLLFLAWNKVVAAVTKVKTVQFWQALLFLATICALLAPRAVLKKRHCWGGKGNCAYERVEKK